MRTRYIATCAAAFTALGMSGLWAAGSHSYLSDVQPGFGRLPLGERVAYSFRYIGAQVAVETGEKHAVGHFMGRLERRIYQPSAK